MSKYLLLLIGLMVSNTYASSIPVGVTIQATNCPQGTVLVIDDVETNWHTDDRGKLRTIVTGLASYPIAAQMHDVNTGKDYELVTTTAAMDVVIHLDCNGTNFVQRKGF